MDVYIRSSRPVHDAVCFLQQTVALVYKTGLIWAEHLGGNTPLPASPQQPLRPFECQMDDLIEMT